MRLEKNKLTYYRDFEDFYHIFFFLEFLHFSSFISEIFFDTYLIAEYDRKTCVKDHLSIMTTCL